MNEAKEYLRVYHNGDDNYIAGTLIPAARSYIEQLTRTSLIEKRVHVSVKNAHADFMLPYWPVQEVESIVPADLTEEDGYLNNGEGVDIEITYIAEQYVMPQMKQAILNLVSHWYVTRDLSDVPEGVHKGVQQLMRTTWLQ